MSGMKIPAILKPILWLAEKLERKTTPPECRWKTCRRDDCADGCKDQYPPARAEFIKSLQRERDLFDGKSAPGGEG